MKCWWLEITLKSDLCAATGDSEQAVTNMKTALEHGLPIIPAKRLKGCLLNEGKEIVSNGFAAQSELADLFGRPGASHPARLHIGDAHIYRIPGFLLGKERADGDVVLENYEKEDVYKRQNLRTALYAYLIAKHEGGDFLLRIEDTDQERYVEGAVEIIYQTLKDTGLIHDEGPDKDGGCGPYVQSERHKAGIYMEYAKMLVEKGEAYYCFCTPERLESLRRTVNGEEIMSYDKHCLSLSKEEVEANLKAGKPFVIRQNNPTTGTTTFNDEIYGDITVDNSELDDMVLIKSDGYPTYNFANVVDDHLMSISHVVRGNEYLSSDVYKRQASSRSSASTTGNRTIRSAKSCCATPWPPPWAWPGPRFLPAWAGRSCWSMSLFQRS